MELKLKPNASFVPVDLYENPCHDAFARETKTTVDNENKILTVEYAVWRNQAEADQGKPPLKRGAYQWERNAKEAVYSAGQEEIWSPEVVEQRDENDQIIVEGKEPELIQEAVEPVMLVPRYGAFDSVFANISLDQNGRTTFGQVGEQWLLLNVDPWGNRWGDNWDIVS